MKPSYSAKASGHQEATADLWQKNDVTRVLQVGNSGAFRDLSPIVAPWFQLE
jgi:hypothetical protein